MRNALIKDGWTITHDPFRLEDKSNNHAHERLQDYPFILHLIKKHEVKTFVFDELDEIILAWKKKTFSLR